MDSRYGLAVHASHALQVQRLYKVLELGPPVAQLVLDGIQVVVGSRVLAEALSDLAQQLLCAEDSFSA